jgi:hypothetical protein
VDKALAKSRGCNDPAPDPNHDPFEFPRRVKASSSPFVLALHDGPKPVVKDAFDYQRLPEVVEREVYMEDLRLTIEDMKAGRGVPIEEMFSAMRRMIARSERDKAL